MAIVISPNGDARRIELDGAIDISAAAELKAALVEALGSGAAIRISVDGMTDVDVTIFQLLWAAQREAERLQLPFHLAGELRESVRDSLAPLGLDGLLVTEMAEAGGRA
jgi:anti-anti-sigma regulatory factor